MATNRWYSINEFMESINELLDDTIVINVNFDDWNKTKYNWNVKVIGFSIVVYRWR